MSKDNTKQKTQQQHIPQNISDSIPYSQVFQNGEFEGIFEVKPGSYSKSYIIPEVNFGTAQKNKQYDMASEYSKFISSFDAGTHIQITLYNRKFDEEEFKKNLFLKMKNDSLNAYREEYNQMLLDKMAGANNNLTTIKILTVTIGAIDVYAATEKFAQIDRIIADSLATLTKQSVAPLTTVERLDILNSIYNQDNPKPLYETRKIMGREVESFSLENCAKQGITTKDVIAPSGMDVQNTKIGFGNFISKSYFVQSYPSWIRGDILTSFAEIPTTMLVSVIFNPMDPAEAIRYVKRQGTNVSSDLVERQKKASRSGYSAELISPDLQDAKAETNELMEQLTKDNSKLFTTTFVFTLFAESDEEMKGYEAQLFLIGNKSLLNIRCLTYQQEAGLNSCLPIGNNQVQIERLMTSETIASIIPFDVKDVKTEGGIYYGLNAISNNLILYNRASGLNPNSCILGMPGAGKTMAAKREMLSVVLNTDDEVYVIDPEREYVVLAEELGGAVVKIASGSDSYINPFDLNLNNVDDEHNLDPVKAKQEFIATICEIMIGWRLGLSPIEKSIIDRCTSNVYDQYIAYLRKTGKSQDMKQAPTLLDFYNVLVMQPQPEAQTIALALERYVCGGLDIFSHQTNLDITNRFTVYDIKDIGPGLKELGLQICLDNVWNKMIENQLKGKRTWFYIDEFYLMMQKPTSAAYISEIWKRARKWNGYPCAITQNVEDMLKSEEARTVINNCSFITLLGQAPMNKQQLSDMFGLSPVEQKYIEASKPGMGLILVNNDVIPMNDDFPRDTKLYKMMTTKPDERMMAS